MKLLCLVLVILLSFPVAATELSEMDTCLGQAKGLAQMKACTLNAFKQADQSLNFLYRAVLETQTATQKKRFGTAQQAWLKYRDSYCVQFMAAELKGDEQITLKYRCLTKLTLERNEHFSELLSSP